VCNQRGFRLPGQAFRLDSQGFFTRLDEKVPSLQAFSPVDPLSDGTYDGIVVDATEGDDGSVALELAISSGARRGDMVVVRSAALGRSALDALGLPVTLTVEDGEPTVRFDE
jgi:hypothetical protein